MTVYIEDVNDNVPTFLDTPYEVTVDELTPTGTKHVIQATSVESLQNVDVIRQYGH